jgi:DNA-directed RNA polymerase specialized sigma24 family protein
LSDLVTTPALHLLADRAASGDAAAWRELWRAIQPTIWAITGKWQFTGPLSRRDDERRDIVLEVMERLRADDFRRLKSFLGAAPERGGSFKAWLATVTARAAIDHVRAHPEYLDPRAGAASDGPRWVTVVPMPDAELAYPFVDPEKVATAVIMLERARKDLAPDQLAALYVWLHGGDHGEIAARLGLASARDAERLVRAALKRLRDRYAEDKAPRLGAGQAEEVS